MNFQDTAVIIAVTQAIKHLADKAGIGDFFVGVVNVIVAASVGAALAFSRNTDIIQGCVDGLVAAGIVTVAKTVSAQPSR